MIKKIKHIGRQFFLFLKDIYKSKSLIWILSKQDLKTRFAGSMLGIVWAFIQPLITILILWFIFEKGFRSKPVGNYPFILWLSSGIIPFFLFQEALASATNSITDNRYLLNKVAFRVSILPLVKILSALIIHMFFLALLFVIFAVYGYYPDIFFLQIFYYLFSLVVLLLGLSWITSSAVLFFRDIGQFVSVILQFWFWGTPIFWSINMLPERFHFFLKLNPLFYIVTGYRDCFINKIWFWHYYNQTAYFWLVTGSLFILGAVFFKKLRPHFADVI